MTFAHKAVPVRHVLRTARQVQDIDALLTQNTPKATHIERVLRCRKCFRSGRATWESTSTGGRALLALSDGFHRRARMPLSLPPEIVCNCGTVQPDHD